MDLFNKIAGPLTPGAFQWILQYFQEHLFYTSFCEWLLQLIKPRFTVSWDQLKAAFFVLWKCRGCQIWTLREKCPNRVCLPYSVRMGENTDQKKLRSTRRIQSECGKIRTRKNSVFGHFWRSWTDLLETCLAMRYVVHIKVSLNLICLTTSCNSRFKQSGQKEAQKSFSGRHMFSTVYIWVAKIITLLLLLILYFSLKNLHSLYSSNNYR